MAPPTSSGSSLACVFLLLVLASSSWVAQGQGGAPDTSCVQKLLPCKPFLENPGQAPSPTCCVPLTGALKTETQCLCSVFNNAALMKSLNVTKDAAMQLLKGCNATVDLKVCDSNKGTSAVAPAGAPPSTDTSSAEGGSTPPSASGATSFNQCSRGCGIMLAVVAAWVALFSQSNFF